MKKFHGVWTALVTPMKDDKVDYVSLKNLINYQVKERVSGIVILGTTGEAPTIDEEERLKIIETTLEVTAGKTPVLVGTGSNCTKKAIQFTKQAHELGADGMLVVAPYYNRPNQEGLYLHFSKVAEATDKPIVLYSIPTRCGIEIGINIVESLRSGHKNIVGIKEAGGSCNRVTQIVKQLDEDFIVYSGDDSLALPFIAIGAKGVVSVASNFIGKEMTQMVKLALKSDLEEASKLNKKYYPFLRALSLEPNPVPIKQVLFEEGLIETPEVRLPLCCMNEQNIEKLKLRLDAIKN